MVAAAAEKIGEHLADRLFVVHDQDRIALR
jgi:hypothetical protein